MNHQDTIDDLLREFPLKDSINRDVIHGIRLNNPVVYQTMHLAELHGLDYEQGLIHAVKTLNEHNRDLRQSIEKAAMNQTSQLYLHNSPGQTFLYSNGQFIPDNRPGEVTNYNSFKDDKPSNTIVFWLLLVVFLIGFFIGNIVLS